MLNNEAEQIDKGNRNKYNLPLMVGLVLMGFLAGYGGFTYYKNNVSITSQNEDRGVIKRLGAVTLLTFFVSLLLPSPYAGNMVIALFYAALLRSIGVI